MIGQDEYDRRVDTFKECLRRNPSSFLIKKDIIFGQCAVLEDEAYLRLRAKVAAHFGLHENDVLVVGSGKLGFSIAPHKRYKKFGDESDIDVAIVNSAFFDKVWGLVHKKWQQRSLWDREVRFKEYLFSGWIRPDLFPPNMEFSTEWWEFFRQLTSSGEFGPYKIAGAVYKNWDYLEIYQSNALDACKEELEDEQ